MIRISKNQAKIAFIFGMNPVLAGTINAVIVKFGHSFTAFTRTGLGHGFVIGVVQNLFATMLCIMMADQNNSETEIVVKYTIAQAISASALFVISIIALKVGLITSSLTLTGMAILSLSNYALTAIGAIAAVFIVKELKKAGLVTS